MRRVALNLLILGTLLAGALSLGAQGTPGDSVDYRCIRDSTAAMAASNGVGRRNNLKVKVDACNNRWIARPRTLRVDTVKVIVHDTVVVVRVDTVFVPVSDTATPPPDTMPAPPIVTDTTPSPVDTGLVTAPALPLTVPNLVTPVPTRSYLITGSLQTALDTASR